MILQKKIIILLCLTVFNFFIPSNITLAKDISEKLLINDVSRLYPTYVKKITKENKVDSLIEIIKNAKKNHLHISIAGKQHSQGGHTYYDNSIFLDMTAYKKIIHLDTEKKIITVQSGATWEAIQEYINPFGLAIKVMQSSNIFTVGGSLSANIHGRDPRFGPIIETVKGFRLLLSSGDIISISREENKDLFGKVIGGYGLFGVILDVDLELTENTIYQKETTLLDYKNYPDFFEKHVKGKQEVGLHFGRLSIAPGKQFLKETYVTNYKEIKNISPNIIELQTEKNIKRNKFFFELSRRYQWGKNLRWYLQKKLVDSPQKTSVISRNNAMRPPIAFLNYHSKTATDILQEYYIPKHHFVSFINGLRNIVIKHKINLLSVTLRYVPKNTESFLSYSRQDSFSIVLYINQKLSDKEKLKAKQWTQELVNLALNYQGTHYLTYQLYPTKEQVKQAYPSIDQFFKKKKQYDKTELFMNKFYNHYAIEK